MTDYVEQLNGAYRISGTRVSLDSIVYRFLEGWSPESIAESFPALTLEQVYGGVAFYLGHRTVVDRYLAEGESREAELQIESRIRNAELINRLRRARHESTIPG